MPLSLKFAGAELAVAGEAALFWPKHRALLVADLHLEKASSYAASGQMLPPYDSRATLEAIAALVAQYDARAVWCLGDNYHDAGGEERLEPQAAALLRALTGTLDWRWIVGNHDPGLVALWGGQACDEIEVDDIILRHAAQAGDRRPEMSGHYHPKYRQELRGRMVSRRCFLRGDNRLILPAFGALTGGLDVRDPAYAPLFGSDARQALVPTAGRLLRFAVDPVSA
jgi:DNA ligase-associated metallophosphoesterase